MHYLKGTMSHIIHYLGYPSVLEGYSDSNWITYVDEMKATSGYIYIHIGCWRCLLEIM
jgi:general stress protein CsbA